LFRAFDNAQIYFEEASESDIECSENVVEDHAESYFSIYHGISDIPYPMIKDYYSPIYPSLLI